MNTTTPAPLEMIRPGRPIHGSSAVLLPYSAPGVIDWKAFDCHTERTAASGLVPAINMDTGFGPFLSNSERIEALERTQTVLNGGEFVAGAYVGDKPGDPFNANAYARAAEEIERYGGTPILFQSYGLTEQPDEAIVASYQKIAESCDRFLAFELSTAFAPFGKIYSLDVYRGLLDTPQCIGAKHSSLERQAEWERLVLRDTHRPEFHVYTGNDLAIDMVMYGSDYLLGLSTFCPEAFAQRDAMWRDGDPAFYELNDLLQYLGEFVFRDPVPAYKHSAAMFLHLGGHIATNETHPQSPTRPASDLPVLESIHARLQKVLSR